jgi:hypothetical protein
MHVGIWNMHVGICNMHVETQHLFLMSYFLFLQEQIKGIIIITLARKPHGYLELGSYFLFLQEQIKDIIIICAAICVTIVADLVGSGALEDVIRVVGVAELALILPYGNRIRLRLRLRLCVYCSTYSKGPVIPKIQNSR